MIGGFFVVFCFAEDVLMGLWELSGWGELWEYRREWDLWIRYSRLQCVLSFFISIMSTGWFGAGEVSLMKYVPAMACIL